jgi:hypothetical protein
MGENEGRSKIRIRDMKPKWESMGIPRFEEPQVQDEHRGHKGLTGPQRKDNSFRYGGGKERTDREKQKRWNFVSALVFAFSINFFFSPWPSAFSVPSLPAGRQVCLSCHGAFLTE